MLNHSLIIEEIQSFGLIPVPVVPKQLGQGLDFIQGKQPSYFDESGKPTLLKHSNYHDRQPTQADLEQWFNHPDIGIGSLGSPDGKVCWIDFDAKNFDSPDECKKAVAQWRSRNGIKDSWTEKTGGGGYHVLVRFNQKPSFTKFALEPNGKYIGEIQGYGKFSVLAPSLHHSGNRYKLVKAGVAGLLESAELSGLFPVGQVEKPVKEVQLTQSSIGVSSWSSLPIAQWKPSDYARSYLAALNPSRTDDYEQWIKVGIALRSVGDPYLLDDWINWSKQSSKFKSGECERKWGGFKQGKVTLGTLGYWAKQDGWESPARVKSDDNQKPESEVTDISDWSWNNWSKSRKSSGRKVFKKYFEMPENLPDKGVIVCCKSGLGTGKTTAIINHCKGSNKGSRTIGFINNLLYQTVARFEEAGLRAYHLHGDDSFSLLSDKDSHIFYCLPSIVNTAPSHYEDCDLLIDEIVSVLMAAIDGGTLSDFQGYALEMLRVALLHCDRAFLMDGNLRDIDIELIAKLCPEKQIIVIDNEQKPEPHNIKFIQSVDVEGEIKKSDKSPLIKAMLAADCPFVVSDSLEKTKVFNALLKQSGKQGFVLNSESSGEEWAKEFLANPTEFLSRHNPGYFVMSPSGSAGLDIWWDKISHKFTFISGVLDVNGINQLMFRSRDNKPHYVFCPEKVQVRDRVTPDTYSVKKYREHIDKYINQSASLAGEGKEFSKVINQKLDETIGRSSDLWWEYSTKLGALDRFEKDNFQRCLIYTLEQSGHNVELVQWESCQEVKKEVLEAKENLQIAESKEIYSVDTIPYEDAVKMSKSGTKNATELYQVKKAFLLHKLPGIENNDVWNDEFILKYWVKGRDEISKLERFWMLQNYEVSKLRHETDWYFHSERDYVFKGMFRKANHSTIWALKQLGIETFLSGSWHKESPEIREVITKGYKPDIMLALGFSPGKEKPKDKHIMEYVNKCLDLIGVKLTKSSKVTIGNQRVNTFAVKQDNVTCESRLAILTAIEKRFTEWLEKNQNKANWLGDKVEAGSCPQEGVLYRQGGGGDTPIYRGE
ncbi:MAG TPA: plasmid replication protein, CyRepA1 family, partial [Nostocaceae cyanobacterium]|nr:plasmid replication protein, CyRepA1 family [Nostocaceae cyanobacterium]